ncbi:DNA polymerase Y family protein [Acidovorax sp. Be4]|uniref:DNA polymerase Y family protein n=1 Tax=Acidovorax bellezanensis TaxID=2976702 RepID=A0ABT2PQB3_9BURK|nr:DNA polymerase Y family protein [Acidovorax sp. Be4]MCT9812661.1 DNA polymerase Y family protein [Acidovorax sp. Be4]
MHWAALLPPQCPDSASPIDLQSLAAWALQFTPRVAVVEEAVLLELEASLRLFGGAEDLHALVEAGARELGVHLAWAATGLAALAIARQGLADGLAHPLQQLLDSLPLERLSAVARHQATLARVGCRTLGQVRALPRGGIARRFDKALLEAMDQAYGLRPETYAWEMLPETFHARLELMSRVEMAPALLFGARRLLLMMAGWLRARQLGATAFTLRWCHDSMRSRDAGKGGELTIRTAEPTQNVEHLARLLTEHLAKVELLAPAGDLELLAAEVEPMGQESRSLIPDPAHKGASTRLALERIQARLGEACIRRPQLSADHRLEWMQQWSAAEPRRPSRPQGLHELPLPTWVLETPLRLVERAHRPVYQGPLQLLLGPDRVEGGWWHREEVGDGELPLNVQRDYWLARSEHAGLLWVFQTRLAGEETAWFLHGHYG